MARGGWWSCLLLMCRLGWGGVVEVAVDVVVLVMRGGGLCGGG